MRLPTLCDHGEITVESFAGDGGISSPEYIEARRKVRVVVGSKWRHGTEAAFDKTTVTMQLTDGRVLTETVDRYEMPGTSRARLSQDEIREKFEANCRRAGFDGAAVYAGGSRIAEMGSIREGLALTAREAVRAGA